MNDENKIDDIKMTETESKLNEEKQNIMPENLINQESEKIRESKIFLNVQNQNLQNQNLNVEEQSLSILKSNIYNVLKCVQEYSNSNDPESLQYFNEKIPLLIQNFLMCK